MVNRIDLLCVWIDEFGVEEFLYSELQSYSHLNLPRSESRDSNLLNEGSVSFGELASLCNMSRDSTSW